MAHLEIYSSPARYTYWELFRGFLSFWLYLNETVHNFVNAASKEKSWLIYGVY